MTKSELRELVKTRIRQMRKDEREAASVRICSEIVGSAEWRAAKVVLLYAALPDEVGLDVLFRNAEQCGKRVLLPVVDGNDLRIKVFDPHHVARQGKYGILEPTADCPELGNPDEIDLAIIPGRAFTRDCMRMGRGKGYYDRTLISLRCLKWGVAFACQIVEMIPADPWDIRLDRIVCDC